MAMSDNLVRNKMLEVERQRYEVERCRLDVETKKLKDLYVATKVSVQLQLTDASVKSRDRVVKKTEKDSLYAAIDVAAVWLERALASR